MEITQRTVDRIIARAQNSDYGLGNADENKADVLQISRYEWPDLNALALLLVNAYHDKYDLISVFRAAMEEITADHAELVAVLREYMAMASMDGRPERQTLRAKLKEILANKPDEGPAPSTPTPETR